MTRRYRMVARVCVVMCLVLMVPAPQAAMAFHDPEGTRLVDERTIEGPFWFVYRVRVLETSNRMSWEIDPTFEDAPQTAYGLWLVPADGQHDPFFFLGAGGPAVTEVRVAHNVPTDVDVRAGPFLGFSGPSSGFAFTSGDRPLGDYWLVVVNTAPGAAAADVRLYLSDEVELVATAEGTTGGLLRETDFDSDEPRTHVQVGASLPLTVQAQHHHLVDGRASMQIDHHLFGLFSAQGGDPNDASYVTPDGQEHTKRFVFSAREPGPWEFRVNEWFVPAAAGVGAAGLNAYIALLWADVDLPPAPEAA